MNVTVQPGPLTGELRAPASKSEAHRALICAALAPQTTDVACSTTSADIDATVSCLEALGARVARTREGFRVRPIPAVAASAPAAGGARERVTLDCGESGSTLRFLLPVACALGVPVTLVGHGRLPKRPLSPLYEQLVLHGARLSAPATLPLEVDGGLTGGRFELPGTVSSQFVSGLILAAPLLREPVEVVVTEPVESRPYIELTASVLEGFGVEVSCERGAASDGSAAIAWRAHAPHGLASPGLARVGGDWSNAAFWLAAGALGTDGVTVRGLDPRSAQGDRNVLAALSLLGARVLRRADGAACAPGELCGRTIDVRDIPDLVPPLAAVAAFAQGATRFTGAERLKIKESDRLASVSGAIRSLGGRAEETADGIVVEGAETLPGGTVDAMNDHRIAMMASVMAARCEGPVTVLGAECVEKSYPAFFEDLLALGGSVRKES